MGKKPSNTPLIVGVVLALVLLLGANMMAQNNNPEIQERLAKEKEAQVAEKQAAKGGDAPKNQLPEMTTSRSGDDLVLLGEKKQVGFKDGLNKFVIGYEWTPSVQANPDGIKKFVEQLRETAPKASIEVVNVDSDPNVTPGVSLNGKVILPPRPDGTVAADGGTMRGIVEALRNTR